MGVLHPRRESLRNVDHRARIARPGGLPVGEFATAFFVLATLALLYIPNRLRSFGVSGVRPRGFRTVMTTGAVLLRAAVLAIMDWARSLLRR